MTNKQREILTKAVEEAAEFIASAGKALAHGLESSHPDYDNVPNRTLLSREAGDFVGMLDVMWDNGLINGTEHLKARESKPRRFLIHAHHQQS
jgi:hypothetical protein